MPEILKKRDFISIFFVLSVIIIAIIFFSISLPGIVIIFNQPKNTIPVGEIYGDTKIGQTFLAEYNGLSGIEVLMATYNRENSGEFTFHLKSDVSSKEDLYSFKGDMSKVQDNAFFRFSFQKIENSKKKRYFFYFEAPLAQPGNAITLWSDIKDLYKDGEKIINGVASQGDLVFKTEYELGMRLSSGALRARIIKFKAFLVNIFLNKVFYFLLFIIIFIWAFIILAKKFSVFSKKGGFILVCFILFMAVFIWIIMLFSKKIVVFNQPINNTTEGEIYGNIKIGQTFEAEYNNLTALEVLLATYNRENRGDFIFHLKNDVSSEGDLFHYRGDIGKVKDNSYFRFKFPKINNSKGEKFYFYLEAPQSGPGNAITIWSNTQDLYREYREGERIVNGVPSEGDLVFKTVYDMGLKGNLATFLEEITRNKPSPLNKKYFYVGLILLFVLSCSLFMAILVKFFVES